MLLFHLQCPGQAVQAMVETALAGSPPTSRARGRGDQGCDAEDCVAKGCGELRLFRFHPVRRRRCSEVVLQQLPPVNPKRLEPPKASVVKQQGGWWAGIFWIFVEVGGETVQS